VTVADRLADVGPAIEARGSRRLGRRTVQLAIALVLYAVSVTVLVRS